MRSWRRSTRLATATRTARILHRRLSVAEGSRRLYGRHRARPSQRLAVAAGARWWHGMLRCGLALDVAMMLPCSIYTCAQQVLEYVCVHASSMHTHMLACACAHVPRMHARAHVFVTSMHNHGIQYASSYATHARMYAYVQHVLTCTCIQCAYMHTAW